MHEDNIQSIDVLTKRAMAFTKDVTTKWDSRIAGSQACQDCAAFIRDTIDGFCDRSKIEEFNVRPGAFLGYIRINVALYIIGLLALFFNLFLLAVLLASLSVLITVLEFFYYREFVDFLFPKRVGKNVIGEIDPDGEILQQVIISAHHDSAHIFNFLQDDPASYNSKVLVGTLAMFSMFVVSWLLFLLDIFNATPYVLYWGLVAFLVLAIYPTVRMWFFYKKRGTPGAGDNLVCSAIAIEVARYFADKKRVGAGLKHTKVIVASWDAEEAGLRGSRAFVRAHKDHLLGIKTYNFNLECMYDHNELSLLVNDLNSFVPLSRDMVAGISDVASRLGYDVPESQFPIMAGGTDAAEFAKAGVEATTLAAMSWTNRGEDPAYHTTRDTIEAVDPIAVSRSIEIGVKYIEEKDNKIGKIS